jgi:8-oxo-dGTP pyrophosphatase MutT (NUDIX family)
MVSIRRTHGYQGARETDMQIAHYLFGWDQFLDDAAVPPPVPADEEDAGRRRVAVPAYSTTGDGAFAMLRALAARGWTPRVEPEAHDAWSCTLTHADGRRLRHLQRAGSGGGLTAARAIATCAVEALEMQVLPYPERFQHLLDGVERFWHPVTGVSVDRDAWIVASGWTPAHGLPGDHGSRGVARVAGADMRDVPYLPVPNATAVFVTTRDAALGLDLPPLHLIPTVLVFSFTRTGQVVLSDLVGRGLDVPGGHVEPGETPAQAAVREALEETGARVKLLLPAGYLRQTCGGQPDGRHPHPLSYQLVYAARTDGVGVPTVPAESNGGVLLSPEDALRVPIVQRLRPLFERAQELAATAWTAV